MVEEVNVIGPASVGGASSAVVEEGRKRPRLAEGVEDATDDTYLLKCMICGKVVRDNPDDFSTQLARKLAITMSEVEGVKIRCLACGDDKAFRHKMWQKECRPNATQDFCRGVQGIECGVLLVRPGKQGDAVANCSISQWNKKHGERRCLDCAAIQQARQKELEENRLPAGLEEDIQ